MTERRKRSMRRGQSCSGFRSSGLEWRGSLPCRKDKMKDEVILLQTQRHTIDPNSYMHVMSYNTTSQPRPLSSYAA